MPSFYTYPVADGTVVDLKPFALACARSFGALVRLRDDPSDAEVTDAVFAPSEYFPESLRRAEVRLAKLNAMSPAEREEAAATAFEEEADRWRKEVALRIATRARYNAMLEKVLAWQPPSADHQGLQTFMVAQINEAIEWDTALPPAPTRGTGEAWALAEAAAATRSIQYLQEKVAEELALCAQQKAWYLALVASL